MASSTAPLRDAGINPEDLLECAAEFIHAQHWDQSAQLAELSADEVELLSRHGARVVADPAARRRLVLRMSAEYGVICADALSQQQAADYLGVSQSRVRQRLLEGSLFAIQHLGERLLPRFQFEGGQSLPHLAPILRTLGSEAHPLRVFRFFGMPNADLQDADGNPMSVREWLISGGSLEPVLKLAEDA